MAHNNGHGPAGSINTQAQPEQKFAYVRQAFMKTTKGATHAYFGVFK